MAVSNELEIIARSLVSSIVVPAKSHIRTCANFRKFEFSYHDDFCRFRTFMLRGLSGSCKKHLGDLRVLYLMPLSGKEISNFLESGQGARSSELRALIRRKYIWEFFSNFDDRQDRMAIYQGLLTDFSRKIKTQRYEPLKLEKFCNFQQV